MDHSCFCKHAPVSQMYQQRVEKCKCGKNTKTNKQWVKKEAQRSQEPCLLVTGHCAWLLHEQPVTSRTMSTSHRTMAAKLFHADRWTDGHEEANSHFSQFCERA